METKEYFEKEMFFESLRLPLDKISCTRQFESKLSLRSFAKSLAKEGPHPRVTIYLSQTAILPVRV